MKPILIAATVLMCCALAGESTADVLYAVPLGDGLILRAATELGGVVRHVGTAQALVEGDEALGPALGAGGRTPVRLEGARGDERLYVVYAGGSSGGVGRVGEVVWSEPEGAALVACPPDLLPALRAISFMVYPLPESIDVAGWFDNVPPAHVRRRGRDDELRVRGLVEDAMDSVSADSLMEHVVTLSESLGGELRTRFVYRTYECLEEAKPYIVDKLTEYLPESAEIRVQDFYLSDYTCEEGNSGPQIDYHAENIIGVLPGTGRLSGYYIVCAHYDAIAVNSFPGDSYWWCTNPAPGADDNATGVAAVLEAARVLSGLSFPFDIRFVLFSGEELGLKGSYVYANSVAGYRADEDGFVAARDTIYGVFNVDMVAYKTDAGNPDSCDIVTNPGSVWLADWMVGTAESLYVGSFPDFEVRRIDKALAYSDHAAFWQNDYDAVVALENWSPGERNPY
ncbi:MAG: M28 family peptidase, partial [Candidatus Eisenbacteria bacterium]|nr:M28 family peptidase [Candidatus Eisenbacteria bacterium]